MAGSRDAVLLVSPQFDFVQVKIDSNSKIEFGTVALSFSPDPPQQRDVYFLRTNFVDSCCWNSAQAVSFTTKSWLKEHRRARWIGDRSGFLQLTSHTLDYDNNKQTTTGKAASNGGRSYVAD